MTNSKKLKKHLNSLSRPQLVALAHQRTQLGYPYIQTLDSEELIAVLAPIPGVLKPVNASGGVAVADEEEEEEGDE